MSIILFGEWKWWACHCREWETKNWRDDWCVNGRAQLVSQKMAHRCFCSKVACICLFESPRCWGSTPGGDGCFPCFLCCILSSSSPPPKKTRGEFCDSILILDSLVLRGFWFCYQHITLVIDHLVFLLSTLSMATNGDAKLIGLA